MCTTMAAKVFLVAKHSIACLLVLLCLSYLVRESNSLPAARPPWMAPGSSVFLESAGCHNDDELLDLCQRCAKLTKSRLAYPSCCSLDLQARRWCSDYVYFGRGEHDFYK